MAHFCVEVKCYSIINQHVPVVTNSGQTTKPGNGDGTDVFSMLDWFC